jgi:hypothetical protein
MTKAVSLVHPRETVKVSAWPWSRNAAFLWTIRRSWRIPSALKSSVSVADFRRFVSALEGDVVGITKENVGGLSLLCDELGFEELAVKLSEFR